MKYTGAVLFVCTFVRACRTVSISPSFDDSWSPILYHCFDVSWLVPSIQDTTTWLVSWLPPLSCHSADHSQRSQDSFFLSVLFWMKPHSII